MIKSIIVYTAWSQDKLIKAEVSEAQGKLYQGKYKYKIKYYQFATSWGTWEGDALSWFRNNIEEAKQEAHNAVDRTVQIKDIEDKMPSL